MSRDRKQSKLHKKRGKLEERLNFKNAFNINDPTAYEAIENIRKEVNINE